MNILSIFGEILTDLLLENNLVAEDMSEEANINSGTISLYKRGTTAPSIKNLIKIAKYFNCTIDYLFGRSPNKESFPGDFKESFINRLDSLLVERRTSIYYVAKELDFSKSIYYDWKKGSMPSVEKLVLLADYFGVSTDYLLGLSDKR